jgi:hypothetical protein
MVHPHMTQRSSRAIETPTGKDLPAEIAAQGTGSAERYASRANGIYQGSPDQSNLWAVWRVQRCIVRCKFTA